MGRGRKTAEDLASDGLKSFLERFLRKSLAEWEELGGGGSDVGGGVTGLGWGEGGREGDFFCRDYFHLVKEGKLDSLGGPEGEKE